MASERQIAANRRNAYRHGLSLSVTSTTAVAKQVDKLVRKIAGNGEDAMVSRVRPRLRASRA
jgi:hypothetical protein